MGGETRIVVGDCRWEIIDSDPGGVKWVFQHGGKRITSWWGDPQSECPHTKEAQDDRR